MTAETETEDAMRTDPDMAVIAEAIDDLLNPGPEGTEREFGFIVIVGRIGSPEALITGTDLNREDMLRSLWTALVGLMRADTKAR